MRFRPIDADATARHLVDDDSGIEFFEKNWRERVRQWVREGEDSRLRGITFVLRDLRWAGPDGGHDIEFKAASLARIVERKASQSPRIFRAEVIYGFDVPTEEFERRFAQYTGGNLKKIAEVRDFVKAAILFYLGSAPDAVVNFT